jgi:hypothetical protein
MCLRREFRRRRQWRLGCNGHPVVHLLKSVYCYMIKSFPRKRLPPLSSPSTSTTLHHLPCKQSDGYPIDPASLVLPTHGPFDQPTPVTIPIFSLWDSFASAAVALVYAASHVPTARLATFSSMGMAVLVSFMWYEDSSVTYPILATEQPSPAREEKSCAS